MKKLLILALALITVMTADAFFWNRGCGCGCKRSCNTCCQPKCCPTYKEHCEQPPCCEKVVTSTVTAAPCAHVEKYTTYTCPDGYTKVPACNGEEGKVVEE